MNGLCSSLTFLTYAVGPWVVGAHFIQVVVGGSVVVHRTRRCTAFAAVAHRTRRYTVFAAVGSRFIQVAESKETSLT